MHTFQADIAIVGAGGAGLRAAIAAAEADPKLKIALISKVYPMRSHTVAAEGGAAAVTQAHDSLEAHFHDTVAGGDWLCEQDVVDDFVARAHEELVQMEHWGCPWSRKSDGHINVRAFGGMKIERTWFAADKTGFHMLHTLFQTSIKYPSIQRFDEHFAVDLLVTDGRVRGVLAIDVSTGEFHTIYAKSVVLATGGAGRVFRENTNGGIVTGDGMALAFRHGVPLRDMEFVQYHPTCMPGTGLLFTEACRGEGGFMLNKDGYRYLQDYGLGPPSDKPRNKYMELGPRDRLSQAYWHEKQKGRTLSDPRWGSFVHLDLRHLGEAYLRERLPQIYELSLHYLGVDPAKEPIPVLPAVHYTMGGITADGKTAAPLAGLYSVGECSSVGIHGANRLGSNSLTELCVFGKTAGVQAAEFAHSHGDGPAWNAEAAVRDAVRQAEQATTPRGGERIATLRKEMAQAMEDGCGIYRTESTMRAACEKLVELKQRYKRLHLEDTSRAWNTERLVALELGYLLDVAQAMAHSALERRESRGSHQRLDAGYTERDDVNFLKHSLATYRAGDTPAISYGPVKITRSQPGKRVYGAAGDKADAERHEKEPVHA